jgi:hypothetical protein
MVLLQPFLHMSGQHGAVPCCADVNATRGRSCSALVEDFSGQLDIIYWQPIYEQRQQERARLARAASAAPAAAGAEAEEGAAAGAPPAAHSHEEPPAVGPATAPLGQGDKQVSGVWRLCVISKHGLKCVVSASKPCKHSNAGKARRSRPAISG